MKKLSIVSDNCLLTRSTYSVEIDGEDIGKTINRNLPKELAIYSKYPVSLKIEVEILGESGMKIEAEGYEIKAEDNESEGEE